MKLQIGGGPMKLVDTYVERMRAGGELVTGLRLHGALVVHRLAFTVVVITPAPLPKRVLDDANLFRSEHPNAQ